MPEPQATLRRYVTAMRSWLRGKGQPHTSRSDQRPIPCRSMWRRWPHPRSSLGVSWLMASCPSVVRRPGHRQGVGRPWPGQSARPGPLDLAGLALWRESDYAQHSAPEPGALFTTFPFFQRLFRAMGYADERLMERGVEPGCADRPAPGCGLPAPDLSRAAGNEPRPSVPLASISRSSCQRWELRRHERSSQAFRR